jgi:hypothetical protein
MNIVIKSTSVRTLNSHMYFEGETSDKSIEKRVPKYEKNRFIQITIIKIMEILVLLYVKL